uniref:Uncharacterized protein n=1 Tax=Pelusios castaneus TaxID=367368 RepID=A0A8C8S4S3_9SAUR
SHVIPLQSVEQQRAYPSLSGLSQRQLLNIHQWAWISVTGDGVPDNGYPGDLKLSKA